MTDFLREQMSNQFLSGGLVLLLTGAAMAVLKGIPIQAYYWAKRYLVTTADVSDEDLAFLWLTRWLSEHPYSKKSRLLSISTRIGSESQFGQPPPPPVAGKAPPVQVIFSPAPGKHLVKFEGHYLLFHRIRREAQNSGGMYKHSKESFTIQTFSKDRDVVRRLIQTARESCIDKRGQRVDIFTSSFGQWQPTATRLPRDPGSVILDGETLEGIFEKVSEFTEGKELYRSLGIPYQLGLLFYGPPGNGKTSTILAVASRFNMDIYWAKVSGLDDILFRNMLSSVPEHAIVLIEDVDCLFENREPEPDDGETLPPSLAMNTNKKAPMQFLTLSGFLNTLDGITGSEGRVVIMTTNYPDRLDAAIGMRRGRVDVRVEIKNASRDQARRMYLRFFPGRDELANQFSGIVGDARLYSMSDLQGHLMDNRASPEAAAMLGKPGEMFKLRAVD